MAQHRVQDEVMTAEGAPPILWGRILQATTSAVAPHHVDLVYVHRPVAEPPYIADALRGLTD
jgi:hypothetical protein